MTVRRSIVSSVVITIIAWVLVPQAGFAQLDSSCMVSALNRTAPVQADGVWVLPNVPANLGQVRVRATCIQNGVVRFGASSLITVPPNGVIKVESIDFQGPPPVPSSLSLASPQATLGAIGQTVQLLAVASFPDGSTSDVTQSEKGTDYRSSNPAIASVDANGLVTAHASGVVLMSAVNEGALGVIRLQVVTSGDSDGDGLPDDWELAHGLDPNNPVDALDDPDQDGLTTLAEYQGGTDPFNPDSDGDGLSDGQEVAARTNPLLADTDGDGLRDGLEVRTGSDPLDPNSFNLAAALQSIEVTPSSFRIVFNTILGEASRQLRVLGHLIDGSSLDITSKRYGTTYGSSDLQLANFGPEDGRIYAGQDGSATIRVGNNGFSATTQVTVETFAPQVLSFLRLSGFPNNVALSGDFAFIAAGVNGLFVVDVADPLRPYVAGSVVTHGNANDVRIVGDYAFVASGLPGVVVVDVRDPGHPRVVGQESTAGFANDLVVAGGRAYVADEQGLSIVDVSDPTRPHFLGAVAMPGRARGVDVADSLAVVATEDGGVFVVDVHDPENPAVLGSTATRPGGMSNAADVVIRGRFAYVADGAEPTPGGLRVIDFRDPANPVIVGSSTDSGLAVNSTALEGGLAVSSDYFLVDRVAIFSADPVAPQFRGVLDFSPFHFGDFGHGLAVRDGFVYMVASSNYAGIQDSGVSGSGALYIGRYAVLGDDAGVPPTVTISAPAAGDRATEREPLLLHADARDDVRVASVRFLVNGQTVFTDYDAPYEYTLTPAGSTELRIGAIAVDGGGNEGSALEVVVPVDPNHAPVAALLAPVPGQAVTEGTSIPIVVQASDDRAVTRVGIYVDGTLRKTFSTPPYRFDYTVPFGTTGLTASAIAYDDAGPSRPASLALSVRPDGPPNAAILLPRDGSQVVEGSPVEIVAGVSDDVGLRIVRFLVDGAEVGFSNRSPFLWTVSASGAGGTMRFQVIAEDTRGHQTASPEISVSSIPDPLTEIRGRTVDASGVPVVGARVEAEGAFALSGAGGSFSLAGLPTNDGGFSLSASAVVDGFELHGDLDGDVTPLPGGVVEVGEIVLTRDDAGATLTGRTVDEAGSAIAGSTVKVYDQRFLFTTTSGPDGRFTAAGAPSQGGLTVSAMATAGGARVRGILGISAAAGEVNDVGDLVLSPVEEAADPGTTVRGTVLDGLSGSPVAGAAVRVFTSFDVFPAVTGADGTFSIAGVPTLDGDFNAAASAVISGVLFSASPRYAAPVPGDTTDFWTFFLYEGNGSPGVLQRLPDFLRPSSVLSPIAWQPGGPVCPAVLPTAGRAIFGGL
jgi:hypothetical protein